MFKNTDSILTQPDIAEKLRLDFAKNQKNTLPEIKKALSANDTVTAHRLAHNLKGLAGLIGEAALKETATSAEFLLKSGKIPDGALLRDLETELNRVLAGIEIPVYEAAKPLDTAHAKRLFDELEPLLEANDSGVMDILDELRTVPETAIIVRQIEEFEFKPALKNIKILRDVLGF